MVQVAVVILNWNGENFLRQFLPVLLQHTDDTLAQIVVADNHSTDGSIDLLKKDFPSVNVILLDQNYGFAGGYNMALKQIEAKYYVLLNSDVEVSSNWLEPMYRHLELNMNVVACQPKILSFRAKNLFEHAGAAGGFIDYLGYPFCRGRVFDSLEEDQGQYDEIVRIFWASGACLFIRADIFHQVGGFDDTFFAHMEEIDLCWRLNARGYQLDCVTQSVVYHVGGGTLNTESPQKTYLNFRNNLLMLYKNLPQAVLEKILFKRRVLDYIAAFQLFVTGKPKNALSVLQARRDFKRIVGDYDSKRNDNILFATCTHCNEMLDKSILFEYYLHKKKYFKDIMCPKKQ
ncbi:MAG: glycosyl transferase family 2 [Porphyromonadaceae bacterium CG2_30_38_12]|nr:MAG: glycosyl transferase family 2 [Porphyromonadaceae bacterium CG2_30_38_12]